MITPTETTVDPILSVGVGMLVGEMSRHTTFRFCLDPTDQQEQVLARHAGAARLAFNQCLGMVKTALTQRRTDPNTQVPWTGFDLINAFNGWKKTDDAGRFFTVGSDGAADVVVTGLRGVARFASRSSRRPAWIWARV